MLFAFAQKHNETSVVTIVDPTHRVHYTTQFVVWEWRKNIQPCTETACWKYKNDSRNIQRHNWNLDKSSNRNILDELAESIGGTLSRARDRMVLVIRSIGANPIPNEQDIKFSILDFFGRAAPQEGTLQTR